jgi:hypothetical protein
MTTPNGQTPMAKLGAELEKISRRERQELEYHNRMRASSAGLLVIQVLTSIVTWILVFGFHLDITIALMVIEVAIVAGFGRLIIKDLRHRRHCVLRGR